jgi:hypothetical protein
MTMHWKPLPEARPPRVPLPGEWVTITVYCGCREEVARGVLQVPPDGRLTYRAYGHLRSTWSVCNTRGPTAVMQWFHQGPEINLRAYERPHP